MAVLGFWASQGGCHDPQRPQGPSPRGRFWSSWGRSDGAPGPAGAVGGVTLPQGIRAGPDYRMRMEGLSFHGLHQGQRVLGLSAASFIVRKKRMGF
jgi:hypothetical protein